MGEVVKKDKIKKNVHIISSSNKSSSSSSSSSNISGNYIDDCCLYGFVLIEAYGIGSLIIRRKKKNKEEVIEK